MFNKNRKTKKSLLISTYECLISHYNFIENNNNLYLYGKKDKTKKIYQVTPNKIILQQTVIQKILYAILKVSATKFVLKNLFLHVLVLTKILFILIHLMKINL